MCILILEYLAIGKSKMLESTKHQQKDDDCCPVTFELNLQFEGVGISFVDDQNCHDVLYLRLESTMPMWEGSVKGNKFKNLPPDQMIALEKGYVNFVSGKNRSRPVTLEGGIKVKLNNILSTHDLQF